MRFGAAMLIGAATLLSARAGQSGGYAPSDGAASYYSYYGHATPAWYSDEPGYYGPEYAAPAYPGYADEPGYYGPGNYGPGVIIGGGGFWGNGYDRDRYWYHRHRGGVAIGHGRKTSYFGRARSMWSTISKNSATCTRWWSKDRTGTALIGSRCLSRAAAQWKDQPGSMLVSSK